MKKSFYKGIVYEYQLSPFAQKAFSGLKDLTILKLKRISRPLILINICLFGFTIGIIKWSEYEFYNRNRKEYHTRS